MAHYALWLDHQYAYIYKFTANGVEEKTLKAEKIAERALLTEPLEAIQSAPIEPRPSSAKKFLRVTDLISRLSISRPTIYSRLDCSGLLIPDTNLGENDRHREVSDDKATSYVFH